MAFLYGGAAHALGVGALPDGSVPEVPSIGSQIGDGAEDAVPATVGRVVERVRPASSEPVPSLLGPVDEGADGVSAAAYRAFEELVTASPDGIVVRGVVTVADAFAASGVDGGVAGVTSGVLGATGGPQLLRVIR